MKDLTKLLGKGNLSPRERVLLMIKNDAHKQKTGKALVTEADIAALTINWKPKDYKEAEQYNKYLNVWNSFQYLEMDMQTNYLTTQLALARLEHIASLFYYKKDDPRQRTHYLERIIPDEQADEFRDFFLQHTGFEYDRLVHLCTFYSLPKKLQQDILLLDPSANSDHTYFLAEEQLARTLTGKQSLTDSDISTLTKHIIDSIPWGHELALLDVKISVKQVIFNMHFGGYPLLEFGKRLASRYNITYTSDDELKEKLIGMNDLKFKLENVVRDSIHDGLFFDEYIPVCNSSGYVTYEGKTQMQHDEIMKCWIKAKDKTIKMLQQHINSGELILQECPTRLFEVSINKTYVTGESLANTSLKLQFVTDYQKQIDEVLLFGYPCFLVHQSYAFENSQYLFTFKGITQTMSKIIDVDLNDSVIKYIKDISDSINTLNFYLRDMTGYIDQLVYDNKDTKYPLQTFLPDPSITLNNLNPKLNKSLKTFIENASKLPEWKKDQ